MQRFDVIVVGLGHAGAEAALASARMGGRVAAITQVASRACLMSCNPAIGGPGKSQLVREIDALGGAMALAADASAIQVRLLNRSKGAASWATRLQVDRFKYAIEMQRLLVASTVSVIEGEVATLEIDGGALRGVRLVDGTRLECGAAILTTGTFLAAKMHVGLTQTAGGRAGDRSSTALPEALADLGLRLKRFKTGTPPRLDGRTIDYRGCAEQPSEPDAGPLSRRTTEFPALEQRSTFVTATNAETHAVVRDSLEYSPLTTGAIRSRGPRYCPSLEQKVLHYPQKESHVVYLEPDGLDTFEVYPAGLSTSLPEAAQRALLRTIPGLERVELVRPGYAVEYDCLETGQLQPSLEHKGVPGLFFAGQINGSSGYEEAAAQGLVAGANAMRATQGQPAWVPSRADSFIGVLCDDLVRQPLDEPYRVLPSKAEHRLRLREDNAPHRLSSVGAELGLVAAAEASQAQAESEAAGRLRAQLTDGQRCKLLSPDLSEDQAIQATWQNVPHAVARLALRDLRYAPYEQQRETARVRLEEVLKLRVPETVAYRAVPGLSAEAREALERAHPSTLAEAAQVPGVTDAALAVLAAHLKLRAKLESVSRGTIR